MCQPDTQRTSLLASLTSPGWFAAAEASGGGRDPGEQKRSWSGGTWERRGQRKIKSWKRQPGSCRALMWGRHVQPLVARYQESLRCTPACSRTLSGLTRHPLGGLEEEECGAPVCCGLPPCSSMNSCIPLNCGAHIRSFHSFSPTSSPRLGTCFFCSALNLCNVVKLIPPPSATYLLALSRMSDTLASH